MDSLKHDINSQCTYLFLEYISILSNVLYQTSIDNLKIVELAKQDNFVNQTDNKNCGIFYCIYAKMFSFLSPFRVHKLCFHIAEISDRS